MKKNRFGKISDRLAKVIIKSIEDFMTDNPHCEIKIDVRHHKIKGITLGKTEYIPIDSEM